jgi:sugar lactone lactonase YvrE
VKQKWQSLAWAGLMAAAFLAVPPNTQAQESAAATADSEPQYPLAVAVAGPKLMVVDLDLPGVWLAEQERTLMAAGSKLLRKPMNRPRCIVALTDGNALVGDSATREIYLVSGDAEPKPLTNGYLGIPMAMAVAPDGKTVYIGDAEKRATFRMPIEGGKPELVARVNARGLAFDGEGNLWAVTPDDAAIKKINVESNEVEDVITGRPYQYPNGLAWAGDHGYVTDGYGKTIWKFTADGKTEKWHEGEPLIGPVGIAVDEKSVYVADPKQKQVFQFDRESKEVTERL